MFAITVLLAAAVAQTAASSHKTPAGPSTVVYFDISSTDLEKSKAFYGGLLGWTFQKGPTPGFDFVLISDQGRTIGDLVKVPKVAKGAGTSLYFPVEDIRRSVSKAKERGAPVVFEPMNVPSDTVAGAIAMVRDPDGNAVGLYSPKALP